MTKKSKHSHTTKNNNPWKISTFIFAVLVLVAAFNGGYNFNKEDACPAAGGTVADVESQGTDSTTDKVTIVEYSDFQCPFCKRGADTISQVKENYGDQIEVEFHHFPLNFHPYAQKAAEAAECAKDQGKFWEMHDKMFANQGALAVEDLKKYAGGFGLDQAKFDSCLDNGDKEAYVKNDMAEGQKLGVSGTPAFFINGKLISGAQPYEVFEAAIDAALSGGDASEPSAPQVEEVDTSNDPKVVMTVINDPDCALCDTSRVKSVTEELFPTVEYEELDYESTDGKKLLEEVDGTALPTYVFDSNVAMTANFEKVKDALVKKGDNYVILASAAGAAKYLEPPSADDDAVKGTSTAPVTIIEFSDFECPFCGKFYAETLPKIKSEYIDTGKVKLVHRDYPLGFHANAQKAAEASECAADQGKFWEMHDKLYENQGSLSVDNFKKWASDLGLDSTKFDDCLDSGKYEQEVKDDLNDGQAVGVSGTPAFFVNGVMVSGAQPFENFKQVIDAELAG